MKAMLSSVRNGRLGNSVSKVRLEVNIVDDMLRDAS
jgi:hypothetical protein